jgi:predicted short-subunit dehydrogenase-like oxidoreductase (DUF2520 family)
MRELERDFTSTPLAPFSLAIVGRGRLGNALSRALPEAGVPVAGPLGREDEIPRAEAVLLCVPDAEIPRVAARIAAGSLVGHCSGATRLDALSPHEGFSLHPLMTVTARGASFAGAGAAIAGTTPRARRFAAGLASALGMVPVEVAEADRARYHAAASMASNFLVTLEAAAERLAADVGVERHLLVPLVRAAVENWAHLGGDEALTGPVARGDEATVAAQRSAVAEAAPDLLALFDALVAATRTHAARLREPERRAA